MNEEMKKGDLHLFRTEIDRLIQLAKRINVGLRGMTASSLDEVRASDQVVIALINAKMWTGKLLEARGSEFPKEFRDEYIAEFKKEPVEDECADCEDREECEESRSGIKLTLDKLFGVKRKPEEFGRDLPEKEVVIKASQEIAEVLKKNGFKDSIIEIKAKR